MVIPFSFWKSSVSLLKEKRSRINNKKEEMENIEIVDEGKNDLEQSKADFIKQTKNKGDNQLRKNDG